MTVFGIRSLRQTPLENLIATAYSQERTLDLRIPGAAYGPVRRTRGSSGSRLGRPAALLSALGQKDEKDEDFDPLETLPARPDSNASIDPAGAHQQAETVALIEQALARLPARQREAFLLRYWEELDVAETAKAMGCSEGSVKTHCSRAVHALAEMLTAKGISL